MKTLLLASLLALLASPVDQQTVAIVNPSFEQGESGWQFGPSTGVTQSNGAPAAYAGYGGGFSQVLTTSPLQLQQIPNRPGYFNDGVYVLKFSVANWYPSYPGYFTVQIDFGLQELCESSGWGTKSFTQVTVVCPGSSYIVADKSLPGGGKVQGASDFVLHVTVNDGSADGGWPLLFDNFSLTFTPAE